MFGYIVKRILGVVPVAATVVTFVFLLLRLSPGDPAVLIAGEAANEADIERVRVALGLDKPLWDQFAIWIGQLAHGDLGHSVLSNLPVTQLIAQRLEPTLSLALTTMIFALCVSVPLGVFAAARAGTITDRAVMIGSVVAFSFPVFFTGYLLVWLFAIQW